MPIVKNDVPMIEKFMGTVVAETQGLNNAFLPGAVFEDMEPANAETVLITKAETAAPVIPIGGEIPQETFSEEEKTFFVETVGKSNILLDRETKGSYEGLLKRRSKALSLSVDLANEKKIYDEIILATSGGSQLVDASSKTAIDLEMIAALQGRIKDEYQNAETFMVVNKRQLSQLKVTPGFNVLQGDAYNAVGEFFGTKVRLSSLVKDNEVILYVQEAAFIAKYQTKRAVRLEYNNSRMGWEVFAPAHRIIGVLDESLVARAVYNPTFSAVFTETPAEG